jgi:hypothetical protein
MGASLKIYSLSIGYQNSCFFRQIRPKVLAKPAFSGFLPAFLLTVAVLDTILLWHIIFRDAPMTLLQEAVL